MPSTGCTPRIVPYGADQTVYLVIDRFSVLGAFTARSRGPNSKLSFPIF